MSYSNYVVTAPLVIVPDERGSQQYFYYGAAIPQGLDADRVKQLFEEGMLGEPEAQPEPADDSGKPATVDEILAEVGDDKEKAAAALEAEKAGKNRSSLVSKLEAIASKEE